MWIRPRTHRNVTKLRCCRQKNNHHCRHDGEEETSRRGCTFPFGAEPFSRDGDVDRRCEDLTPSLAETGRDYVEYEHEIETLWVRSGTQWCRETEAHEHTACSSARLTNFLSLACCGVLCFMTSVRWTCVATHGAHPGFCVGCMRFSTLVVSQI